MENYLERQSTEKLLLWLQEYAQKPDDAYGKQLAYMIREILRRRGEAPGVLPNCK